MAGQIQLAFCATAVAEHNVIVLHLASQQLPTSYNPYSPDGRRPSSHTIEFDSSYFCAVDESHFVHWTAVSLPTGVKTATSSSTEHITHLPHNHGNAS